MQTPTPQPPSHPLDEDQTSDLAPDAQQTPSSPTRPSPTAALRACMVARPTVSGQSGRMAVSSKPAACYGQHAAPDAVRSDPPGPSSYTRLAQLG